MVLKGIEVQAQMEPARFGISGALSPDPWRRFRRRVGLGVLFFSGFPTIAIVGALSTGDLAIDHHFKAVAIPIIFSCVLMLIAGVLAVILLFKNAYPRLAWRLLGASVVAIALAYFVFMVITPLVK